MPSPRTGGNVLRQAGGAGVNIDALPKPAEIVDHTFDLRTQMLEAV